MRWQGELDTLTQKHETTESKEEFLKRIRTPLELAQTAAEQYVRQGATEKTRLLQTPCSNYTVTDGSLTVSMHSPLDLLLRGAEEGDWLGVLDKVRTVSR